MKAIKAMDGFKKLISKTGRNKFMANLFLGMFAGLVLTIIILYFVPFNTGIKGEGNDLYCPRIYGKC